MDFTHHPHKIIFYFKFKQIIFREIAILERPATEYTKLEKYYFQHRARENVSRKIREMRL